MTGDRAHPWRELRHRPDVDLIWSDLDIGLHGQTNGDVIELDWRLGQAERRVALTHELDHLENGHHCGQDERIERQVRARVARRLIPLRMLGQSLAFSLDLDAVAFDLWVTRPVLDDRIAELTADETAYLMAATEHHREWK